MTSKKLIAIYCSDSGSECPTLENDPDFTSVKQNQWKKVPIEEWIRTVGVVTCMAIGCTGIDEDGVEVKALGHFGQQGKQVKHLAQEVKTWQDLKVSYVGGWGPDSDPIVQQFNHVLGLPKIDKDMSHIHPFNFPRLAVLTAPQSTAIFRLGFDLNVEFLSHSTELDFNAPSWDMRGFEIQTIYEQYARQEIGPSPVDLFLNSRPTLTAFKEALSAMNEHEKNLTHIFYELILENNADTSLDFFHTYKAFLDEQPSKKAKPNEPGFTTFDRDLF